MKKSLIAVLSCILLSASSCNKDILQNIQDALHSFGYDFQNEQTNTVPTDLNTQTINFPDSASRNLPSAVDLTPHLPPVGDQGQYGTCVAWATAYNMKSCIEGEARGLSTSDLTNPSNQMSPKDLYLAIPDNSKGSGGGGVCEGTYYEAALSVMQDRGVATLATVPYTSLNGCYNSGTSSAGTSEAANHKIKTFRKLDATTTSGAITNIKVSIANGTPVVVGTVVGANFQQWRGGVMQTGYDPVGTGDRGGHAMTIIGYDDSKGSSGAFKVVNSWSTAWGDNGFFWADYNFLVTTLCSDGQGNHPLFIADNNGGVTPPDASTSGGNGVDLTPWVSSDVSTQNSSDPTEREIVYNIYNIGTSSAQPLDWGIYYLYYNAYDANDYGIIFYDEFNNSVASGTYDCPDVTHCYINVGIPAGSDLAQAAFQSDSLFQDYDVPNISGTYYLVMLADPDGVLGDVNSNNNAFYTTSDPKVFQNGVSDKNGFGGLRNFKNPLKPEPAVLRHNQFNSAVNVSHKNAYTPQEIINFIKKKKRSGELYTKVVLYRSELHGHDVLGKK